MQPRHTASALFLGLLLAAPAPLFASMEDIQAKYNESAAAMKANKIEDAARLSGEALAMAEAELGAEAEQTGVLAYNTGVLYVTLAKWQEARGPLEKALAAYQKSQGKDSPKLLPVMDKLQVVYTNLRDVNAGAAMLDQKLEIVSKAKGEKSKEAADVMRDLAVAETLHGKHDKARRLQRRALAIYEDTVGEKSAEVGGLYLSMSFTEFTDPETGASKLDTAPKYQRKGIEIFESVYPLGSKQLIDLYSGMVERMRPFAQGGGTGPFAKFMTEMEEKLAANKAAAAEKGAAPPEVGTGTK